MAPFTSRRLSRRAGRAVGAVASAPVAALVKGAKTLMLVGRLKVMRGEIQALDVPLYAGESVGVGSLPQRAVDGLMELGGDLVRRAAASLKRG